MEESQVVFWAEKIANNILERERFHFSEKKVPELKKLTVKSSSSLSGVLHIGRLSDIIRGEAVYRALKERDQRAEFIYVTEDMDPLRKVPAGVPKSFSEYIGVPVSDIPDPEGCHESYAVHFKETFLQTFSAFLTFDPKVHSMREEYKKGNFTPYIIELVSRAEAVKKILNRTREKPVSDTWSPWKPICDKCGKLQTTVITKVDGTKIHYVCRDYEFESEKALGCGYEGTSDLKKANGKLVWKSEWAAQWKRWSVASEGAGKEYNAPNSAWFVNAEICESVLGFPMPEPIFYEHLLIDDKKMSASVGNVVYPHEWLEVGRPETLKLLYMKRLLKTRSFSWKDLPSLESELDKAASVVHFAAEKGKDNKQLASLFSYSAVKGRTVLPLGADYSLISHLTSVFPDDEGVLRNLIEMGLLKEPIPKEEKAQLLERVSKARKWMQKYAPEEYRITFLEKLVQEIKVQIPKESLPVIKSIMVALPAQKTANDVQKLVFEESKSKGVAPKLVFESLYFLLLGKSRGPKIGTLMFSFGKEKVLARLREFVG